MAPRRTPTPSTTLTPTPSPSPTPSVTPTPFIGLEAVLTAEADTFLTEGRPDSIWGSYPGMFVGYDDQGWYRQRALVRFNLAELPEDAAVLRAILQVYIHNCFECRPIEVTTYRVTHAWQEDAATWRTSAETTAEAYGRTIFYPQAARHWASFDITTLAQKWREGAPNHGVMLRGGEEPVSQDPILFDFWGIEAREGLTFPPRLVVYWLPQ